MGGVTDGVGERAAANEVILQIEEAGRAKNTSLLANLPTEMEFVNTVLRTETD